MKKTLLEIVQDILNDTDADPANSIDDTEEATQIAQIVRSTYESLITRRNWPHLKRGVTLQSSLTPLKPTHMTLEENISEFVSFNYDKRKIGETRKRFEEVKWKEPDEFLRLTNRENSDLDEVETVTDDSGVEFLIRNDRAPSFFTSFDDETIVCDAYDSNVDSTLQSSKVQARAYVLPTWVHEDDFIPDLPAEAFVGLIEEAKSRVAVRLNQDEDPKAEQESQRQARWLSRKAWKVKGGLKYPDYGRNSRKGSSANFDKNDGIG